MKITLSVANKRLEKTRRLGKIGKKVEKGKDDWKTTTKG